MGYRSNMCIQYTLISSYPVKHTIHLAIKLLFRPNPLISLVDNRQVIWKIMVSLCITSNQYPEVSKKSYLVSWPLVLIIFHVFVAFATVLSIKYCSVFKIMSLLVSVHQCVLDKLIWTQDRKWESVTTARLMNQLATETQYSHAACQFLLKQKKT